MAVMNTIGYSSPFAECKRHQRHPVGTAVVGVQVGDQRDLLEVLLQRLGAAGVLLHAAQQLFEVLHALARLLGRVLAQHGSRSRSPR